MLELPAGKGKGEGMTEGGFRSNPRCVPAKGKPGRHLPAPVLPDLFPQQEVGGGMGTTPEVCALGRALTLAVKHVRGSQKSQHKTRSYTFLMNSWRFFEGNYSIFFNCGDIR